MEMKERDDDSRHLCSLIHLVKDSRGVVVECFGCMKAFFVCFNVVLNLYDRCRVVDFNCIDLVFVNNGKDGFCVTGGCRNWSI